MIYSHVNLTQCHSYSTDRQLLAAVDLVAVNNCRLLHRTRTTFIMRLLWNSEGEETASPDAPDLHSSITSLPEQGTDVW